MTDLPPELQALYSAERASNVADLARRASVRAKVAASMGSAPLGAGSAARTALTVAKVLVAVALVVGAGVLATRGGHVARSGLASPVPAVASAPPVIPVAIRPAPHEMPAAVAPTMSSSVSAETPRLAPTTHVRPRKVALATPDPTPAQTQAELLHAAWLALSHEQPNDALALAQTDAAEHPTGPLVEERLAIQIEALAALHRTTEADALFTRFASLYPGSVHRSRLAQAIGAKESL
ncbi:MAG TPA: hypothetical protein VGM90_15235 [Kofleriaceae bacterium]|jgi:hypothetical protein